MRRKKNTYKIKFPGKKSFIMVARDLCGFERSIDKKFMKSSFRYMRRVVRINSNYRVYILTNEVSPTYTKKIVVHVKRMIDRP